MRNLILTGRYKPEWIGHRILVSICFIFLNSSLFAQQDGISINQDGSPPHESAILDVQSTNKGFLPPRMTTAERDMITNTAEGLLIYNTDTECIENYSGGQWVCLLAGSASGRVIGELYGGGVIFSVHKDANGDERGLIVSLVDNSAGAAWSSSSNQINTSAWDGASNTAAIISQHSSSAAQICADYTGGGYTDWFLPAISQLGKIWNELYVISHTLESTSGAELMTEVSYWSSSSDQQNNAQIQRFNHGNVFGSNKSNLLRVRCIRAF
ncbi:MAG: DUF1566 domain-containing protein [Chitinophagaceae bacterium]|nr:MAG: DUF1566 domain-containing protein [Chitinophagaceae bacterium]